MQMRNYDGMLCKHHGVGDQQMDFIFYAIETLRSNKWTPITYIEIGVLYGGLFVQVLEKLKEDEDIAFGIDLFETFPDYVGQNTHGGNFCYEEDLDKALKSKGFTNYTLLKGDSKDQIHQIDKVENGIIVIDGNHTYQATKIDFENAMRIIKRGFIFFHDTDMDGPQRVTNQIVEGKYGLTKVKEMRGSRLYAKNSN
jgi:hypothetical protein